MTLVNGTETTSSFTGRFPQEFDLVIDGEGLRRRCVVVWRRENAVGISFDSARYIPVAARKSRYAHYADACRLIAESSNSSHREMLLEMAEDR